jgi:hypothetical protein
MGSILHKFYRIYIEGRILSVAKQPKSGLDRLIFEVSRPHTIRHIHTHTLGRTRLNE